MSLRIISSVIWNTWSRIARMFGGIVNNVDDEPGSGVCGVSECFCDELGPVYLACEVVKLPAITDLLHRNENPPSKQVSIR